MSLYAPNARLLRALLLLSQANATIDVFILSEEAELSVLQVLRRIEALHRRGLLDRRRLRLTAAGLALAVPLCPEARQIAMAESASEPRLALAAA